MSVTAEFAGGPATGRRVIEMAVLEYIFPVVPDEMTPIHDERVTRFASYRLVRPTPVNTDCEYVYKFVGFR